MEIKELFFLKPDIEFLDFLENVNGTIRMLIVTFYTKKSSNSNTIRFRYSVFDMKSH